MALRLSALTKEYVRIPVEADQSGVVVNPTADVVTMAAVASGAPAPGDFKAATWETDASVSPPRYLARTTIGGPSTGATIELAVGTYTLWVKVTDNPEQPVKEVGQLVIY